MRIFKKESIPEVARVLRQASQKFVYRCDGDKRASMLVRRECTAHHPETHSKLLFARESDHHTHGPFKSPELNQAYHLSLMFVDPDAKILKPFDGGVMTQWLRSFFGQDVPKVWAEAPGVDGVDMQHWHFRLWCDERWNALDHSVHTERELRARGWILASEIEFKGKEPRRPYLLWRLWKRLWIEIQYRTGKPLPRLVPG